MKPCECEQKGPMFSIGEYVYNGAWNCYGFVTKEPDQHGFMEAKSEDCGLVSGHVSRFCRTAKKPERSGLTLKDQVRKLADDCFNQTAHTGRSYRQIGEDLKRIADGLPDKDPSYPRALRSLVEHLENNEQLGKVVRFMVQEGILG